jgi:Ser/Thr protein kinase RdoA (MazF antagonist)
LTVIDFDDAVYGYFAGDIGTILFYAIGRYRSDEKAKRAFIERYLTYFIEGYRSECELSEYWYKKIGDFSDLRMIVTLVFFFVKFDEERRKSDERLINSINFLKDKILKSVPCYEYDF